MTHGTRARRTAASVVAALVLAPAMAGCGLFEGGSTLEDALEYLPAGSFDVRFTDRAALAERLEVDDIDPREVSDDDIDRYAEALVDEGTGTELTLVVANADGAPLNDFDVEWEAAASWGDPAGEGDSGRATLWKVGDDLDFDALADDLLDRGYQEEEISGLRAFTADASAAGRPGSYPPGMLAVLLEPDERLVVSAGGQDSLEMVAEVIDDDADSLADDAGELEGLLDAAGDVEYAVLLAEAPCGATRSRRRPRRSTTASATPTQRLSSSPRRTRRPRSCSSSRTARPRRPISGRGRTCSPTAPTR